VTDYSMKLMSVEFAVGRVVLNELYRTLEDVFVVLNKTFVRIMSTASEGPSVECNRRCQV